MKSHLRSNWFYLFLALIFSSTLFVTTVIPAYAGDGPAVGSYFRPEPNLRIGYYWNLESRRDGPYSEGGGNGSWAEIENKLESVDTYLFAMMQVFLDMDISGKIDREHTDRVWVSLYSTTTNYPHNRVEDDPPHVNVHTYWPGYDGDTNAHFTVDTEGRMKSNWYANHHSASNCGDDGRTEPEADEWVDKIDNQCRIVFQERFNSQGDAEFRLSADAEIYTLRNRKVDGRSSIDILYQDEPIYNVQRIAHDPEVATVTFEIKDFRREVIITHYLDADRDSGEIRTYSVEEDELSEIALPSPGEETPTEPTEEPAEEPTEPSVPEDDDRANPTTPSTVAMPPGSTALPSLATITSSQVYFVAANGSDDNPGTRDEPWKTLNKAARAAQAGDTVYFREGVYTESFSPQNSGQADAPIVFASYPGETATFDGGATSGGSYGAIVDVDGVSHVRISGLRIINAGYYGFRVGGGSSHITLDRNSLDFIYSSAFYVSASNHVIIDGNTIERTTHGIGSERVRDNDGTGVAPQEHISVVGGATDFEIRFNKISNPYVNNGHRQSKEGIDIKDGAADGKVFGNIVSGIRNLGIYVDGYRSTVRNVDVFGNIVTDSQNGIVIAAERRGEVFNIRVFNNLIYNNGYERTIDGETTITGGTGIRVFDSDEGGPTNHIAIFHNTIFDNRSNGITISNPELARVSIHNNIVYANDRDDIFILDEIADEVTSSNNLTNDPLFVDAEGYDLRLSENSPAINAAEPTESIAYDKQFLNRDGQPDIGSYEFGAVFEEPATFSYTVFAPLIQP